MPFLIDGHNLIAALPDIELEDPYDEAKLILKLRAWAGHHHRKAIVIFDGGLPGGYSPALSSGNIRVIFAAQKHTIADRIIMERVKRLKDAPNWTVVSSDHEVLDAARMAGAKVLTSLDFVEALLLTPEAQKEKPEQVSREEIKAWLQIFEERAAGETEAVPPTPSTPPEKPAHTATAQPERPAHKKKKKGIAPQAASPPSRTTRTIADQLGYTVEPAPKVHKPPSEKPEALSADEVEAWLEVFHDLPESEIAPPPRRKKPEQPRAAQPLTVDKEREEGLSAEEVDAWLALFPEEPEVPQPEAREAKPKRKRRPPQRSARLQKEQEKRQGIEGEEKAEGLSPEELEDWYRMFGEA